MLFCQIFGLNQYGSWAELSRRLSVIEPMAVNPFHNDIIIWWALVPPNVIQQIEQMKRAKAHNLHLRPADPIGSQLVRPIFAL
jgi:hypothetical protein